MVGGFVEGALGNYIETLTDGDPVRGTAAAAFLSGMVSEITGGKFAVGALTGAMGYLLNQMSRECSGRPCNRAVRSETASKQDGIALAMDGDLCFGGCVSVGASASNADGTGFMGAFTVGGIGVQGGVGLDFPLYSNDAFSFQSGALYVA